MFSPGPLALMALVVACVRVDTFSATPSSADPNAVDVAFDANVDAWSLTCTAGDEHVRVARESAANDTFTVHGLLSGTRYSCTPDVDGHPIAPEVPATTAPLPPEVVVPEITVPAGDPAAEGLWLFDECVSAGPRVVAEALVVLDASGQVRWFFPGVGCYTTDVTRLDDGDILYGADERSTASIIDLDRRVVTQIVAPAVVDGTLGDWTHDLGTSVTGNLLGIALAEAHSLEGFQLVDSDPQTGKSTVVWDVWTDGVDRDGLDIPGGADPWHANAVVDRLEDGQRKLTVSLRNVDQVWQIDAATGAIDWRLGQGGDFALLEADGTPATPDRWFAQQHDAKVDGDLVILHDNGSGSGSRALALQLDLDAHTARIAFEWTEPMWNEPIFGGVDREPDGSYEIAMGHWDSDSPTDHASALVHVNVDGSVRWRAQFPLRPSGAEFADPGVSIYRSEAVDGCVAFPAVDALCRR